MLVKEMAKKVKQKEPQENDEKLKAKQGVDAAKEIRRAVDTGKVLFGTKGSEKSLKNGTAKLLVIASNCPKLTVDKLVSFAELGKIPLFRFQGTGLELGSACGKPFTVSAMAIAEEGK